MAEQPTQVRGQLTVTNATTPVLAELFSWFIADPTEYNPPQVAALVMRDVGRSASHQIGPGLEAETEEGSTTVTLKWERWYR